MPEPEIIWLASWPRSGNTLLRAILWHCFGMRSGSLFKETATINKPGIREDVGCTTEADDLVTHGILFAKTHWEHSDQNRAIYILRDGREACVSNWHFVNEVRSGGCSLADAIRGYDPGFGSWSQHVENWHPDTRPGTLLLRYEDMVDTSWYQIPRCTVLPQLEGFLQRHRTSDEMPPFDHFQGLDPKFFRSGRIDSWRDEMKGDDLKLFWDLHGETMEKYGYANGSDNGHNRSRRIVSGGTPAR